MTLNGDAYDIPAAAPTIADLIDRLGLADQAVAVEVNRQLVPKRHHTDTTLSDGDQVEVVTLVGGG